MERAGFVPRFDVYSGTSVGAVHSCFMAANADQPEAGMKVLSQMWTNMEFSRVYRFGLSDALDFSRTLLGSLWGRSIDTEEHPARIHGLLNTGPLEQLVVEHIPWRRLRRNLRSKLVDSLTTAEMTSTMLK